MLSRPSSAVKLQRLEEWLRAVGLDSGILPPIGIMEKKMETTKMGYIGIIGYILGLYGVNGK